VKRAEVVDRFAELGYSVLRETKHETLFRHSVTGARVGIAHTPSDPNWYRVAIREAERKALTNGSGHLRFAAAAAGAESVAAAARSVLGAAPGPLTVEEIAGAVTKALGGGDPEACTAAVRAALSVAARRKHDGVVRIKRGWYVRDPELAALPGPARESALGMIAKAGPRRAWREPAFRAEALAFARGLGEEGAGGAGEGKEEVVTVTTVQSASARDTPSTATPEPERKPRAARAQSAPPSPAPPPLPAMYEMVGEDPSGLAVLRGEDGRLWLAKPLAAARFE
jgi:hypothetical protein